MMVTDAIKSPIIPDINKVMFGENPYTMLLSPLRYDHNIPASYNRNMVTIWDIAKHPFETRDISQV